MAYFPFFIDIKGQKCLIAGGGMVAYRKVMVLKDYGPEITVVAPLMIPQLVEISQETSGSIHLVERLFEDSDLEGVDFVVAGTYDEALNRRISQMCHERKLPVNVVDVQDECSFIFPALMKEKDITIGISTGGSSPIIAQELKKRFQKVIPEGIGHLSAELGSYRKLVKSKVDQQPVRAAIFREMADTGIRQGGVLTEDQVLEIIDKKLKGL